MILHVAGPSGSGKTTIGLHVINKYPDILVKDLDDIHKDLPKIFSIDFEKMEKKDFYEKYMELGINKYIDENKQKIILFVGFNGTNYNWEGIKYIDIPAKHKFYINIPENEILRRRFNRQIDRYNENREYYFNKTLKEKPLLIDFTEWKEKINANDILYYKNRNYLFFNNEKIISELDKIINS